MPSWSYAIDTPAELLLMLLLCGHVLADFLVQSAHVADRKGQHAGMLLLHGGLTLVTHLLLVLPFLNLTVIAGVFVLALVHTGSDWLKARFERRWNGSLVLFFLDQSIHVALIVYLWQVLIHRNALQGGLVDLSAEWLPLLAGWIVILTGLAFNGKGGTTIVRLLLERFPDVVPQDQRGYAMGRTIGLLERALIFILVLLGQWGALGLVLAAKSIARFKELSEQHFADYYLIGTLSSLLVAIVSGVIVRMVVFQ
jgi:hypothetical protein